MRCLQSHVAGSSGEREFLNQQSLKKALHQDIFRTNLYEDTFLSPSPYNAAGEPPTIFHRVLILPVESPNLREGKLHFDRSLIPAWLRRNLYLRLCVNFVKLALYIVVCMIHMYLLGGLIFSLHRNFLAC